MKFSLSRSFLACLHKRAWVLEEKNPDNRDNSSANISGEIVREELLHIKQDTAEKKVKANKEMVIAAVKQNGYALQNASDEMKADKEVVLAAVKEHGYALEYASDEMKADKEVVLAAVNQLGYVLEYASDDMKANKEVVLDAVNQHGGALQNATEELKANKEVVLAAVEQSGLALEYASEEMKVDKEVVLAAVNRNGHALEYASEEMKANKEVVLAAVEQNGEALEYASDEMKANIEVVLTAVNENGDALQFATKTMRSNKEVVIAAVKQEQTALKFAIPPLNQDHDCLRAAGLFDDGLIYTNLIKIQAQRIVFSTKFSLGEYTSAFATLIALALKAHPFAKDMFVYFPNSWMKSTCDPDWTNMSHPCRGTEELCTKFIFDKNTGVPIEKECCWRSSFVYQLNKAKETRGFMIQLAEFDEQLQEHVLGNGQQIETELADRVGVKVFRVYQQNFQYAGSPKIATMDSEGILVDKVVESAQSWLESDREDMAVQEIY